MTLEEIKEKCEVHHSSLAKGYQSVKRPDIEEYSGRFGKGYKVHTNYSRSSRFHLVTYYIYK